MKKIFQKYKTWNLPTRIMIWVGILGLLAGIIGIVISGRTSQISVQDSNLTQSQIATGENITQTMIINNYYNDQLNITKDELCSKALEYNCFSARFINKTPIKDCINNITFVNAVIGKGALIDNCDVLFVKPDTAPMKSGTIDILVAEFLDYKLNKNRYLFDAADEYNKNRISLYLQPDGFLAFSLFDKDYTSIQIREKLTLEELSKWIQIGITWDELSGNLKLYVNGELRKTRSINEIDFNSGFQGIFIGSDVRGNNQVYAIVDYLFILSEAEDEKYFEQRYFNLIGKPGYGNVGPEETFINGTWVVVEE